MPIHPKAPHPSTGTPKGVATKVNDLSRRIKALESDRTVIGPDSIAGEEIAPGSITTENIQSGAITTDALAAGAITSDKIEAGSITANEIAAGAITANEIAANSITAEHLQAGSVTATSIAAGSIAAQHLQADSITAGSIAANSIGAAHIQAGSIDASLISAGAINANHIQAGAITADAIATNSITAAHIESGSITANEIAAGTVTAANIAAGSIVSTLLASQAVTGDKIIGGAVTSDKISVADLSAVAATMGTVTGGRFQTAISGPRVMMGSGLVTSQGTYSGITGVDASGNVTFLVNAADGSAEFKGTIKTGSTGLGNISGQIDGNSNIVSNTITGDRLVIDAITSREISASSVTAVELAANAVTAGKIAAGVITTNELAAGAVTATTIAATAIDGKTITGATFQTATTGARVVMDSAGLRYINASSVTTVDLSSSAGGLKLLSTTLTNTSGQFVYSTDKATRWESSYDGSLTGYVMGITGTPTSSPGMKTLNIVADIAAGTASQINMYAGDWNGAATRYARILLETDIGGSNVWIQANNQWKNLLSSDGTSAWALQNTSPTFSSITATGSISASSSITAGVNLIASGYVQAPQGNFSGNIVVNSGNTTGGGVILSDDGSMVDNNNGYCSMRFSQGVYVTNGNNSNTVAISLNASGSGFATSWVSTSDKKLKRNIQPIVPAGVKVLDKVRALRGIKYDPVDEDGNPHADNPTSYSVIAQELQEQFPHAVMSTTGLGGLEDDSITLGVKQLALEAVLLEAIKELADKVDELEKKSKAK